MPGVARAQNPRCDLLWHIHILPEFADCNRFSQDVTPAFLPVLHSTVPGGVRVIRRIFFPAMLSFALFLSGGLQAQRKQAPRQFELKAESSKFWELFDQTATLQKMAGDFGFTEGPVWDERDSST